MSLTPPDELGGSGSPSPDDGDSSSDPSLLSRALGRVTDACRTVGRVVRAGVVALLDAPSRPPVDPPGRSAHSDRDPDDSASSAQYDFLADDSESDAAESDRSPSSPVVSTSDATETTIVPDEFEGPDADRPELEVQWHGDAVTFVSPEEPDARITSDVWEDVER